ncbi:MAG: HPr(Ser) kinase/phosphatase [Candidatus Aminicenantes bacterium]|nr:HPr(Ser) kinase/phosphatase [Candidatus Aminicenantes bacterium]
MDNNLDVKDFYERAKDLLKLRPAAKKIDFSGKAGRKGSISVEVWGKKETQDFEKLSSKKKKEYLWKRFQKSPPCVILADNLSFSQEIEDAAKEEGLIVFRSALSQKKCRERMKSLFSRLSPDQVIISGELLKISGLGVLIVGDSGLGKSESALELISRGYRFVCDDAVHISRENNGRLAGTAPPISRNFMEIRGLGIINIKEIFGPKAVLKQSAIDLVIKLEKRERIKEDDRLGLKTPKAYKILGVKIPQINIPVAPGRNIATLIEVACQVHVLKEKGYHAPQDIVQKLNRALSVR